MNQLLSTGIQTAGSVVQGGLVNMPNVDVRETAGSYIIEAEMPGMTAKDVDVQVVGDVLVIRGQAERHTDAQDQGYHISERRYGSFHREVPLPGPVDQANVTAAYENGVLEVRLPKSDQGIGKRIQVQSGRQGAFLESATVGSGAKSGETSQSGAKGGEGMDKDARAAADPKNVTVDG
ncbi:MAG TPA: Hsp20/alpha crystallin family protein [Armatimonadota bacterium]